MVELKTQRTKASVAAFLNAIEDDERRKDCQSLTALLRKATGKKPAMWGPSIVGFGSYHYKYATGREGDMPMAGFSPRAGAMTIYVMRGSGRYDELVSRLGKCKTSVACVYVNKLADVDLATTISELTARQAALQASLQLIGRTTQLTLLDYI
jgi:hypothetical protein